MDAETRQRQPTRNNVRESSCDRSEAELLSDTMNEDSCLVSASDTQFPESLPTLNATTIDKELSPEYMANFKKLNEEDPYTKTKALYKITELVKKGDVQDAVAALSSWANHYQTLTTDSDGIVREAAQECHGALVRASGAIATPALRRLLPAWLLACYDNHATVAELAHLQLQDAFPDSKFDETISFCKSEIIMLLINNLTDKPGSMLSKIRETFGELLSQTTNFKIEIERILLSSLRALELLVTKLPETHDEWLWDKLINQLLHSHKFWKLVEHESKHIRAHWYNVCGRICEREGPRLHVSSLRERFGRALVLLSERGAVAAQRWAAVVQLMRCVENWDVWFERKELLVKRLLSVLKNGTWGEDPSLSIIFLPFLSKLPTGLLTTEFYMTLFNAIFIGLKHKNVLESKRKREMWVDILQECIGFVSLQNPEYAVKIVPYVHQTWLDYLVGIIDKDLKNILMEYSATAMASMTIFWLFETKKENAKKYDELVRNFWLVIGSTISKQIDQLSVEADISEVIETHIVLLNTLEISVSKGKTQRRVQYENQETVEYGSAPCLTEHCDVTLMDRYHHNLIDIGENMCCSYFDFANTKQAFEAVFTALISFIVKFESDNLLMALARHFKQETIYDFYNEVLKHWLAGNTRCEPLVDIVFIVMKYLTEEERDRMFKTFQQFPPFVVEWCLARTLAPPHRASGAAQRWLRGPVAESSVVALGSRDGDPDAMRLLLACLELGNHEEPLLSSTVKSRAVAQLGVECVAAATMTTLAAPAPHWLQAVSVLAALFQYTLDYPCHDESPQYRAWQEARSSWSVVQFALPAALRDTLFVTHARELLHAHVFRDVENLYLDRIANAASLCPHLFVASENGITQSIAAEVSRVKQLLDMGTENPEVPLEVYALRCDCVEGNINCPYEDENDFIQKVVSESDKDYEELTKKDLILFLYNSLFRTFVLRATLCSTDIEMHEILVTESRNDDLLREEFIMEEFNKILHDATVLNVLCEKYAFWPDYDLILEGTQEINNAIDHMSSIMTPELKNVLSSHFAKNAASRGYYWSYASRLFDQKSQSVMDMMPSEDVASVIVYRSSDCHNAQAARRVARSTHRVVMMRSVLAAHARDRALCEQIVRDSLAGLAPADIIISAYNEHEDLMLFKTDLSIAPWSSIIANAAIVEFLEEAVRTHGLELPAHQWDFTVVSLCSLINSLRLSAHRWSCCKVAIIARAVLTLLGSVHELVSTVRTNCESRLALPVQWADVIEPYLTQHLVELIMVVLEPEEGPMTSCRIETINALIASLPHLCFTAVSGAPALRVVCANAAATLRRTTHAARKYLAVAVLDFVTEALVLDDAEKLAAYCSRENVTPRPVFSLGYYNEAMMHLQDQVDAALSGVEVCEGTRELLPGSDGHSAALGLLLLAARLLRQCARARGDVAQLYIELLSEGAFVGGLMASTVRLLPHDVLDGALESAIHPVPTHYWSAFEDVPPLDVYRRCDADTVGSLACFVLCETLGGLAVGEALGWAGTLSTSASTMLRRIVSHVVAPVLQRRLLNQLCESAHELPDDVHLSVEWSRVEVRCELQLEENILELTLQLADEHPLEPPTFTSSLLPAPDTDSIALYLTYQNGTLVNAVKMWTDAVTAHVQSSPQCFICYDRVHSGSGRLPAVPCLQCRNKFHRFCLLKWFRTSRKSNCPLCRTKF